VRRDPAKPGPDQLPGTGSRNNPGELIAKVRSDIFVCSFIGREIEVTADDKGFICLEDSTDVRFWTTDYQQPNSKLIVPDGRDPEAKDLLLNFVISAFVKPVENDDRHGFESRGALEWFRE
jgi:hypothetical protein